MVIAIAMFEKKHGGEWLRLICLLLLLGFIQCKAEQPLKGMELQEKEGQIDKSILEISVEGTYRLIGIC